MMIALTASLAMTTDALLGEPRRWHPLVGFGWIAGRIERVLNITGVIPARLRGACALLLLVAPCTILSAALLHKLAQWPALFAATEIAILYLAIGHRSLREHALAVHAALSRSDLAEARRRISYMVSRETDQMNEPRIAAATVESVLENGSDAIFGALFWFVIAGAPGALAYRLVNTLDAMWGYRTPRFLHFGWAAARLDDALNYLPARLTALSYALLGASRDALHCWRTQAPHWDSPNGGPVMAAGAGALGLQLGGAAMYHGQLKQRPVLGLGRTAETQDIPRGLRLVLNTLLLWLTLLWIAQGIITVISRA